MCGAFATGPSLGHMGRSRLFLRQTANSAEGVPVRRTGCADALRARADGSRTPGASHDGDLLPPLRVVLCVRAAARRQRERQHDGQPHRPTARHPPPPRGQGLNHLHRVTDTSQSGRKAAIARRRCALSAARCGSIVQASAVRVAARNHVLGGWTINRSPARVERQRLIGSGAVAADRHATALRRG